MHYHCKKCSKKLTTFDVELYQEYKKNQPVSTAVCEECLENEKFPLSMIRGWKDQIKLFLTYWYAPLCILTLVGLILWGEKAGVDLAEYAAVFALLGIMSVVFYFYCYIQVMGGFRDFNFFLFFTYLIWFLPAYIEDVIYNIRQARRYYTPELIKAYKKVKSKHKRLFIITE